MSGWMIETLIATTLLMLLVLALREPVSRRFGPRIAYALWLLPALRMVLPPLPHSWSAAEVAPVARVSLLIDRATPVVPADGAHWLAGIALLWAVGSLGFLGWHLLSYRRFAARVRQDCAPLCDHDAFTVQASSRVRSPLAFGVRGKMVVVPADFAERYDAAEQRFALDHEVAHHRRGDLIANFAGLAVLAVHWFNPVAHIAWRAFRLDQEAACDAMVLRGASASDRHAYGTALVKSATGGVPLAACTMTARTGLKTRLRRIVEGRLAPMRGGAAVAGLVVVGGLALTASTGIAARASHVVAPVAPLLARNDVPLPPKAPSVPAAPKAHPAVPAVPVPPAPPAAALPPVEPADVAGRGPDLVLADAGAPVPVQPISTTVSAAMPARCGDGATLSSYQTQIALPDGPTRMIRIAVCAPDAKATRALVAASLAQAHARIAGDPTIPAELRQSILMSLDMHTPKDRDADLPLS